MANKTYNGWTNYPTWAINLWMDNEQGSQRHWAEQAREAFTRNDGDEAAATYDLSKMIEADYEELSTMELSHATGPMADILAWALGEVNYREIAQHWIEDIEEEERKSLLGVDDDEDANAAKDAMEDATDAE